MIKKLFILPLLGVLSIGAFASANYTSDNEICSMTLSDTPYFSLSEDINTDCVEMSNYDIYFCIDTNNTPYSIYQENYWEFTYRVNSNPFCWNIKYADSYIDFFPYSQEEYDESSNVSLNWVMYYSKSPITYSSSSSDWSSNSAWLITIPSSFTSGLTSLVNNFGSTIVWRLPTILLVALGITAIFALFRVVRNYAKSAFKW